MKINNLKPITILSVCLAVSLTVVSFCGSFIPLTYQKETVSMAVQGMGQDMVDLFLVVPLLILTLVFIRKNSKAAFYIFGGTVFYILYSFVIYSLGVRFNYLFLLYCITLGLSLYIFILFMIDFSRMDVENWYKQKTPSKIFPIYLILVALMFYVLWLKDVVPAVLKNSVPPSVSDYDLLVNPVHVLDISVALPGLIVIAFLLLRKKRLGYILTPISLVFIIILAVALTGMALMLKIKGISEDFSLAGIFLVMAVISSVLLCVFLRNLKPR